MKKYKLLYAVSLTLALSILFSKEVRASDGFIELRSTTRESVRCHVTSIRMTNLEYRMPYICWDVVYPIDEAIANYVVWATPTAGGNAINLGTLSFGRGEMKTKTPFSNLFVTIETNLKSKTPTGSVVMRGNVEAIPLAREGKPTPTPTQVPENQITPQLTPAQPQTTRDKLITAFKRAGIAAIIALVALVGLIFVVTRSRG
jgi:hypothetical protein